MAAYAPHGLTLSGLAASTKKTVPLNGWPDISVVDICVGNDRSPFEQSEQDDIAFVLWLFSVTQYVATAVWQVIDLKAESFQLLIFR